MPAHSASEDARKRAYGAGIHVFKAMQHQRRGWHRNSGFLEFRTIKAQQAG
jgi:hypothetical protein